MTNGERRQSTIEELLSRSLLLRNPRVPQDIVPPTWHYDDSPYHDLLDSERDGD
jgi:hypothetical protein